MKTTRRGFLGMLGALAIGACGIKSGRGNSAPPALPLETTSASDSGGIVLNVPTRVVFKNGNLIQYRQEMRFDSLGTLKSIGKEIPEVIGSSIACT